MEDLNVELEKVLAAIRDARCTAGIHARQTCQVRDAAEYADYTRAAEAIAALNEAEKAIVALAWDRPLTN